MFASLVTLTSRHLRKVVIMLLVAFAFALVLGSAQPAQPAKAYGKNALWQVGLSYNCNNPTACQSLGGFWGWMEFDSDGSADATLAGCGHLQGGGYPGAAGAQSISIDGTAWSIGPGSAGPQTFWINAGTMTLNGHTGGPPVTFPIVAPLDTGVPAVPGHNNTAMILGMTPPPGVAVQIQVVQLTH